MKTAWLISTALLLFPLTVGAAIPREYTMANIFSATHDAPRLFSQDTAGNFHGTTQTGKTFSQTIVENSREVRLQKFSIDQAFFYVSDRGIIVADSDLTALSIYLTRAA